MYQFWWIRSILFKYIETARLAEIFYGYKTCVSYITITSVREIFRRDKYLANYDRDVRRNAPRSSREVCDFNWRWNMPIHYIETKQHRLSWKYVQRFVSCYVRTAVQTRTEANRRTSATVRCERTKSDRRMDQWRQQQKNKTEQGARN